MNFGALSIAIIACAAHQVLSAPAPANTKPSAQMLLQPILNQSISNQINLYLDYVYDSNANLSKYFNQHQENQQKETITNILQIFKNQQYPPETFDTIYNTLGLTYANYFNATKFFDVSYRLLQLSGLSAKQILAKVNSRINNSQTFGQLVKLFNIPSNILLLAYSYQDQQVFNVLKSGSYTQAHVNQLMYNLNYTRASEFCNDFGININLFMAFANSNTNGVLSAFEVFGIDRPRIEKIMKILAPVNFLNQYTIVTNATELLQGFTAWGTFNSSGDVLSNKECNFAKVCEDLGEYINLIGTYPLTNGTYSASLANFNGNLAIVNLPEKVNGQTSYSLPSSYDDNSFTHCTFPFFNETSPNGGISYFTTAATYNPTTGIFNISKENAPVEMLDGTPLICQNALYGIGALSLATVNDWVFDGTANFTKSIIPISSVNDLSAPVRNLIQMPNLG